MFDSDYLFATARQGYPSESVNSAPAAWLAQLCRCIPHVKSAYLNLLDSGGSSGDLLRWTYPHEASPNTIVCEVLEKLTSNAGQQTGYFVEQGTEYGFVACSVPDQNGAVALVFPKFSTVQLNALAKLVKSNFGWWQFLQPAQFSVTPGATENESNNFSNRNVPLAAILTRCLAQDSATACALRLATDVAAKYNAERVLIVEARDTGSKLLGISGLPDFDAKQQANRSIEQFVDSISDQSDDIYLDYALAQMPIGDRLARYKQENITEHFALLLKTASNGTRIAIIVECANSDGSFSQTAQQSLVESASPLVEILSMKLQLTASRLSSRRLAFKNYSKRLISKSDLRFKFINLMLLIACVLAASYPLTFRISAPIALEGSTQRAVVAPFEGIVSAANAQAGMTVKKGQALIELDSRQLQLERDKWQSEHAKLSREYDRALAELDHAEAQIFRAQIGQANAELALVNKRISQTLLSAPFDGIVISGDLSRSVGAPVARGEVLLEIAPLDDYRVVLSVDERDIGAIKKKQLGTITLTALPNKQWPFTVTNVASAAPGEDGRRRFRVEAGLAAPSDELRPGMEGIGKVDVGQASFIKIATRRLVASLQLMMWSYLP